MYHDLPLYELELRGSANITCQHSCDSLMDLEHFHPTITIQAPNGYETTPLHSITQRRAFLANNTLTGKIGISYFEDAACGDDLRRHFRLELSDINTTQLNNSAIQCGVVNSRLGCDYYGEGIVYLLQPRQPQQLPPECPPDPTYPNSYCHTLPNPLSTT